MAKRLRAFISDTPFEIADWSSQGASDRQLEGEGPAENPRRRRSNQHCLQVGVVVVVEIAGVKALLEVEGLSVYVYWAEENQVQVEVIHSRWRDALAGGGHQVAVTRPAGGAHPRLR
jgi:hypothetical protein